MVIVICLKGFTVKTAQRRKTSRLKNILIRPTVSLFRQQDIAIPKESGGAIFRILCNSPPEGVIRELNPPALFRLNRSQPVIRIVAVTDNRSGAPLLNQVSDFVVGQRRIVRPR